MTSCFVSILARVCGSIGAQIKTGPGSRANDCFARAPRHSTNH